ncbi:MAG TPA: site-2 protease family protein [Terriglobales bacterium]|nr:site-2 protease family protein [Terriglobales bacterium]
MRRSVLTILGVILLFAATIVTTVHVGAVHDPVHKLHSRGVAGLTYALVLLSILGIHELGHFFTARWRRTVSSFPVFIPSPLGLGTFGAFVRLKTPVWDRSDSFDIGIAGPIAGLIVAGPLMLYSLWESSPTFSLVHPHALTLRSSLLLTFLFELVKGGPIPVEIGISDTGFASWIGIFVSALNLLPVSPLDGGRISAALFGCKRTGAIQFLTVGVSFVLALFVWSGLFMWAALLLIFAFLPQQETLEEFTAPSVGRYVAGFLLFIFALLVLIPAPGGARLAMIRCPYM